ncbi:MAG: FAD-dependent oxidoreductase [Planctomycetes bacterium]|nr:FAD-dependent oxidoreductase [Planctomycetota bacterium]
MSKASKVNTDVLIIGGGVSGVVAAITGKAFYLNKSFTLIRKESQLIDPCSIPYVFGPLANTSQIQVSDDSLKRMGIAIVTDEVVSIDQNSRVCKTGDGAEVHFDKLILALGSVPKIRDWLEGVHLENVFTIPKDYEYIDKMVTALGDCREVVVIGGGFVGFEVAYELAQTGKQVTVVEALSHILGTAFDDDAGSKAQIALEHQGIKVKCGTEVRGILGDSRAKGVLLSNGNTLPADAVIVATGYRPQTSLAEQAGIQIGDTGAVPVDQYMRTSNPDILAVGDCAETRCFITGRPNHIMLASTACAEARIASINLYRLSAVMTFTGTVPIFCTAVGDSAFGSAGPTERDAKKMKFNVVTATYEGVDKHPRNLPGTHVQSVKLIVARDSGVILGGEVIGGASTGELTNLIGFAIQNRMTVNSVLIGQVGTHSLLTAAPIVYPLIRAAQIIAQRIWTV